jgi:hypothetical protein
MIEGIVISKVRERTKRVQASLELMASRVP